AHLLFTGIKAAQVNVIEPGFSLSTKKAADPDAVHIIIGDEA
ncbi:MAG: hypothetical protein ACI9K9_002462, partial [Neolewinella sp.]